MLEKQWKKIIIDGKETFYSVSNYGEVRNDSTGTLLGGSVANNGYVMVHLRQRMDKMCSVHRLVMKAFHPREDMDDLQINHVDGNKTNNYIENLEWSTALDNMRCAYLKISQSERTKPCYQYDLEGNFITEYSNGKEAAEQLNCNYNNIWRCLNNLQQHYFKWQFKYYKKDKIPAWSNPHRNIIYVYDDNGNFLISYDSPKEAAKAFGVSESSINRYVKQSKKLRDFVFSKIPL